MYETELRREVEIEMAKPLKEMGYPQDEWRCRYVEGDETYVAPSYDEVLEWLRKEKNFRINIICTDISSEYHNIECIWLDEVGVQYKDEYMFGQMPYIVAVEKGIERAIDILNVDGDYEDHVCGECQWCGKGKSDIATDFICSKTRSFCFTNNPAGRCFRLKE